MELKFNRVSEVSVQGEFYHRCRLADIPCYLGYKYEHSVFDCVIYDKDTKQILCLVEIKSYINPIKEAHKGKQFNKYSQYKIPLFYILRLEDIDLTIRKIQELLYQILKKEFLNY